LRGRDERRGEQRREKNPVASRLRLGDASRMTRALSATRARQEHPPGLGV